jgi:hypothetical protein
MRPFRAKSPMNAVVVSLLACVLVPFLALAQEAQAPGNLNTITSVSVRGGTVEIVGTKKPNFTTFTMTDPPRLVIDISEAVFSGVKEDMAVGNGTISGIRTASYGSDESAIARVLIGYEREVETDIQASGNSLVVNVVGGGGAAVAARPTAPTGTAPADAAPTGTAPAGTATTPGVTAEQATVAAQADRKQQERAAADAAASAQVDQKQQERAAADAAASAQADRQAQERAAADAAAAAKADAEAQRQAQARADADRKAQEEAARAASAQAEQQRLQQERAAKEAAAAAEKQRQQDEARAAAEEKKRQQAEAQAAAEEKKRQQAQAQATAAEEKKRQQAEERQRQREEAQAAAEEKKRQQEEARAAAEDRKREQAEERQRQREEAQAAAEEKKRQQAEARQTRIAQAETPRREPVQGGSAGVSSRRKTMTLVGFRQESSASRVFVRTNEPVRYTVTEGERMVVLELENTSIAESNNTRALDTSFFDTAVAAVDADAGPSRTVRVAIRLKERVPYETRQEGNEVSIEFQRPARR